MQKPIRFYHLCSALNRAETKARDKGDYFWLVLLMRKVYKISVNLSLPELLHKSYVLAKYRI